MLYFQTFTKATKAVFSSSIIKPAVAIHVPPILLTMEAFFLGSSPKLLSESPCREFTSIFLPTLALLRFLATLISPPLISLLSTTFSFSVVFDFSFDSEYHHIVDTTRAPCTHFVTTLGLLSFLPPTHRPTIPPSSSPLSPSQSPSPLTSPPLLFLLQPWFAGGKVGG
jgi:hypothetical protein